MPFRGGGGVATAGAAVPRDGCSNMRVCARGHCDGLAAAAAAAAAVAAGASAAACDKQQKQQQVVEVAAALHCCSSVVGTGLPAGVR